MRLIALLLIPAMLLPQTAELRRLTLGNAQLTLVDGRKEEGRIVRVTDRFVSFQGSGACEDIELSRIAKVQRLRTPGEHHADVEDYISGAIMLGVLVPIASVYWVVDQLKPPPVESGVSVEGRLDFQGLAVKGNLTIVRGGRYSVAQDGLHLAFDGEPEKVTAYVYRCTDLVLDNPEGRLQLLGYPNHVSAPIVGRWANRQYSLNFKPDGRVEELKEELRIGTFETTGTGVRIHGADTGGFGGKDWNGQIERRRVVVRFGSKVAKFQCALPGSG